MEEQDRRHLLKWINQLHRTATLVYSDFAETEIRRALAIVQLTTNTAFEEQGQRLLDEATNVQTQAAILRSELEALRSEVRVR
jgi:hypothetical protein